MRQKHNIHRIICNFVAANGPQRWSDLHQLVLMIAGRNLNEEHWGISYLDNVSPSSVMFPKGYDTRYLYKGNDGLYHISNENNTN